MAAKGNLALDKRAQSTLAQRVTKVLGKNGEKNKGTKSPGKKKRREKKPTLAQRVTAALAKKKTRKAKKQLTLAQRVCCWPSWLSLIKGLSFSARFFNPSTAGMAVKKKPVGSVWVECFFCSFLLGLLCWLLFKLFV